MEKGGHGGASSDDVNSGGGFAAGVAGSGLAEGGAGSDPGAGAGGGDFGGGGQPSGAGAAPWYPGGAAGADQ